MRAMQLQARQLLAIPFSQIWDYIQEGNYIVELDNGEEIEMHQTQVILSRYAWEFYNHYPEAPIKVECCFKGENFGPNTLTQIINATMWVCFDHYQAIGQQLNNERMSKLVTELCSNAYNDFIQRLDEYPSSSCVLDFLEIMDHPKIKTAVDAVMNDPHPTNTKIERCYAVITETVKDVNEFPLNQISMAARSGNTKMDALLQTVGVRGNATDIDSRLFRKTIKTNYLYGIRTLADQMMDSRTSAKALSYSRKPMQDSEYLNRRLQLTNGALFNLHIGNCGTTRFDEFAMSTVDILRDFEGKFYLDDDGIDKPIRPESKHLLNRVLKIRTLASCVHPDRYGVCSHCYGEKAYSIMPYTNIGHQGTINMQSPIGQLLLSAKHFTSNADASAFAFGPADLQYISPIPRMANTFQLANRLSGMNLKVQVLEREATGLNSLPQISNVSVLSPTRISELTMMAFILMDDNGNQLELHEVTLSTGSNSRMSSFTQEALAYIKEVGWEIADNGTYEINMSAWNTNLPFLFMPLKQFSTPDYMSSIERMVRGETTREVKALVDYNTTAEALTALHEMVSERMEVNIVDLESIILSIMVESVKKRDYRLPTDKSRGEIARAKDLIFLRSLAPYMAYETQSAAFFGEESFIITRRPSSPLDDIICPPTRPS
jgi:hypothetical protein